MKGTRIRLTAAVIAALLLLSACANGADTDTDTPDGTEAGAVSDQTEETEVMPGDGTAGENAEETVEPGADSETPTDAPTEAPTEPETEPETEYVPAVLREGYGVDRFEEGISVGVAAFLGCCEYYADTLAAAVKNGEKWVYSNSSKYVPQSTSFDHMVESGMRGANCAMPSNWGLIDIGAMPEGARFYGSTSGEFANRNKVMLYLRSSVEVFDLREEGKSFAALYRAGRVKAGDIFLCDGHTFVYRGNKTFIAAGHDSKWHSDPSAPTEDASHAVFDSWVTKMAQCSNTNCKVNFILRIKDTWVPRYYRNSAGEIVKNPDK